MSGTTGLDVKAAHRIAAGVAQGDPASALKSVPHGALARATAVVHGSFVDGLNVIFLIGAIVAAIAAVLAFALIRNKDFAAGAAHDAGDSGTASTAAPGPEGRRESEARAESEARPEPASSPMHTENGPAPEPEVFVSVGGRNHEFGQAAAGADEEPDGVEAVLRTTDQALEDLRRRVGQMIDAHRDSRLAAADEQARKLRAPALSESERYAERLQRRTDELASLSARCRAELRRQASAQRRAANGAREARAELYRLIGEIAAVANEAHQDLDLSDATVAENVGGSTRSA